MVWVWILGVGSYYLIPSLGPFHSDPATFAQVSAFASLHVGVTTVIVLMLRYYRFRRASRVLAVYLAGLAIAGLASCSATSRSTRGAGRRTPRRGRLTPMSCARDLGDHG